MFRIESVKKEKKMEMVRIFFVVFFTGICSNGDTVVVQSSAIRGVECFQLN